MFSLSNFSSIPSARSRSFQFSFALDNLLSPFLEHFSNILILPSYSSFVSIYLFIYFSLVFHFYLSFILVYEAFLLLQFAFLSRFRPSFEHALSPSQPSFIPPFITPFPPLSSASPAFSPPPESIMALKRSEPPLGFNLLTGKRQKNIIRILLRRRTEAVWPDQLRDCLVYDNHPD